ncbi:type VI secretion system protein TssA [Paludibacterium purpuratum]|uniref:Type VI secretion system protein ImpA n=1 Tax=Paludibacterium purpuratum TaxID=1144873 RepID=A0A4V3DV03_9NEIS|nr:type VI secretion system protein TssA [Paludibacterium purpuratum]TDR78357.1 type VI secretion system protein ImpA [Paludibacterium purpuratum]
MALIDIDRLLAPCSDTAPCGDDLEYSSGFIELMQLAAGTPEVQYGAMRQDAAEPDWQNIIAQAEALMTQSHDLRLALLLTRALLARHGLDGLADGMRLILGLLAQNWARLYPRLDPDDDHDPTERNNILLALCDTEPYGILGRLRTLPFIEAPGLDPITLRMLELASDPMQAQHYDGPALDGIAAACRDNKLAALEYTADRLGRCLEAAASIEQRVGAEVGTELGVDLAPLTRLMQLGLRFLEQQLPHHPEQGRSSEAPSDASAWCDPAPSAPDRGGGGIDGEIHNSGDVARLLEQLCQYYARAEPSSPIPILLTRARKLVDLNFMDIMNELSPSGVAEIQYLSGIRPDISAADGNGYQ